MSTLDIARKYGATVEVKATEDKVSISVYKAIGNRQEMLGIAEGTDEAAALAMLDRQMDSARFYENITTFSTRLVRIVAKPDAFTSATIADAVTKLQNNVAKLVALVQP